MIMTDNQAFYQNVNLQKLTLNNCNITEITQDIENLTDLQYLDLSNNKIQYLPELNLPNLKILILSDNQLQYLPNISQMQLQKLIISKNNLTGTIQITSETLKMLDLSYNKIININLNCHQLINLDINHNRVQNLNLNESIKLTDIDVGFNQLQTLNTQHQQKLINVNLQHNQLREINFNLCNELVTLNLNGNKLNKIDFSWIPLQLKELSANDNQIDHFEINGKVNQQKQLIEYFQQSQLTNIQLQNNELIEILPEFFILKNLNKIDLLGNKMTKMRTVVGQSGQKLKNYLKDKLPLDHYWYKINKQQESQQNIQTPNMPKIIMENKLNLQFLCQCTNCQELILKDIITSQDIFDSFIEILIQMKSLQKLTIEGLRQVDEIYITDLDNVRQISLTKIQSSYIQIQQCKSLTQIQITYCNNPEIVLYHLTNLQLLYLNNNLLSQIPKSIYSIQQLAHLDVSNNHIQIIQDQIRKLSKLQVLNLANNNIRILNNNIGFLINLQQLFLSGNQIIRPSQQILSKPLDQILSFLRGE